MVGLEAQRHAGPGLTSQHFDDAVARCTEDLDARRRIDRLRVRACGALGNDLHVKRHRLRVRVDLDDATSVPSSFAYSLNAISAWLVRVDELDEAWQSRALIVELPRPEPVGGDENERSGHGISFLERLP